MHFMFHWEENNMYRMQSISFSSRRSKNKKTRKNLAVSMKIMFRSHANTEKTEVFYNMKNITFVSITEKNSRKKNQRILESIERRAMRTRQGIKSQFVHISCIALKHCVPRSSNACAQVIFCCCFGHLPCVICSSISIANDFDAEWIDNWFDSVCEHVLT